MRGKKEQGKNKGIKRGKKDSNGGGGEGKGYGLVFDEL